MSGIRIVVAGAGGRIGQTLVRAIAADRNFALTGALVSARYPDIGQDAGIVAGGKALGVALSSDAASLLAHADALIDFTTPVASVALAELSAKAGIVHVVGTTGFSQSDDAKIRKAAERTAIVKSGNMSLGVNLLAALVKQAVKAMPDFDIEIVEMHHRQKADAPSGTALLLGEAAAEARGVALNENSERGRDGQIGARKPGAIGFASLRGGTVVGEHEVILAGPHERVVLGHVAEDRIIFATGALAAARWAQGRKPGLYAMADVLGL
mgnify:FL=1